MNVINILLISNTLLSNLLNIICSSVTLIGLYFQKSEVRGFKATVANMAAVNLFAAIVSMILFPISLVPPEVNTYLLGQYYPDWLLLALVMADEMLVRMSQWVLGIIFIYRTMVVLRPGSSMTQFTVISTVMMLVIPIFQVTWAQQYEVKMIQACDYWCVDQMLANQTLNTGIWKKVVDIKTKTFSDIMDVVLMTGVTVTGFKCRKKLHNFFKEGAFSERTIRLQRALSKGMLLMIAVHVSSLYIIFVALFTSILLAFLDVSQDKIEKITTVSGLVSDVVIHAWQMPVLAVVVLFSIRGFIRFRQNPVSVESTMFKNISSRQK